ncbi:uncharacterized protein [Amphiura filiformis]|uniref:uncharacterized protein n=1 Tax=Amphiura filiformis TaxID=82378 RepID=UPI003B22891B
MSKSRPIRWVEITLVVILAISTIGCYGAYLPQDVPAPDSQWSGNCGPLCIGDIDYFCEEETDTCEHCDIYCGVAYYVISCRNRCPAWYAQNVIPKTTPAVETTSAVTTLPLETTTPVSSQWQGNCGRTDGLTCGHDIDYYCEQETGLCEHCDVYCPEQNEYMCRKECPEWYAKYNKPTPTIVPTTRSATNRTVLYHYC